MVFLSTTMIFFLLSLLSLQLGVSAETTTEMSGIPIPISICDEIKHQLSPTSSSSLSSGYDDIFNGTWGGYGGTRNHKKKYGKPSLYLRFHTKPDFVGHSKNQLESVAIKTKILFKRLWRLWQLLAWGDGLLQVIFWIDEPTNNTNVTRCKSVGHNKYYLVRPT